MKIFRHKENKLLYTVEHVIHDLKHLNNNGFAGIHPHPYRHAVGVDNFYSKDHAKCYKFVSDTFDLVSEE